MTITKEQYEAASKAKDAAEDLMNQYHREQIESFEERLKNNPIFTADELRFSRSTRCPCGAGLAYPKDCGVSHYWDCSAILMGTADKAVQHNARLPFAFYEVKSENDEQSTRPKP